MLIELGFDVAEASSAEEANGLISAGARPDVIITNHLMPGMTSRDLAYKLRDVGIAAPVLIISGYAEDDRIVPELSRLTKPFCQSELATGLSRLRD